jgi:hypothetical protein
MKLAVIGSRDFENMDMFNEILLKHKDELTLIISGGSKGADAMAERWAKENGIETLIFLPNWSEYGRSAGVMRNHDIIKNCDLCIAFWDGKSKGTASGIRLCKKYNKRCKVYYSYSEEG